MSTHQRKVHQGEKKDKARTMGMMVQAVGRVLESKGYTGLTAANIAKEAGVDRKLVSLYFGSVENLIETYIKGKDYWVAATSGAVMDFGEHPDRGSRDFLQSLLLNQLDEFTKNVEMQKAVLWQISEKTEVMSRVTREREKVSEIFFAFADKEMQGKEVDLRAVSSLLVAGIYYLVLHAKNTDSTFCEIDITTEEGMNRIKEAVKVVLRWAYDQ